jgi:L-threonylcarbamoyladenylate synthase
MNTFSKDINKCIEVLNSNGIILYPTDTIWGIGCDATSAVAIKKIYELKRREEKKSLIILVSDERMVEDYVKDSSPKIFSYLSQQKKPTTAIFKNAVHLPKILINEDGTIAIRITKDKFCKTLIQQLKKPLVSTSANISGEKYPQNFVEVSEEIKNGVDYIVQHRQNDFEIKSPSSIIKLNDNDGIEIIR